jgi:hypothetical protein
MARVKKLLYQSFIKYFIVLFFEIICEKEYRMVKEYKAVIYRESALGSLLLGSSKVNPIKITDFLNKNAQEGWRVITMEKDIQRLLVFFKREAYLIILERDK